MKRERKRIALLALISILTIAGCGQEYDKLGFAISLNDEKICVGFRKDSDLTREADSLIQSAYEDGSINALVEKYGIENAVLE